MYQLIIHYVRQMRIYMHGWPEPYIYVYIHLICGDFQAKNTVCAPYIYGSGQSYLYACIQRTDCVS